MKRIKLQNPSDHISTHLTHWTGRKKEDDEAFSILKKIVVTKQLKFSYNTISFPDDSSITKNLMICFADIPLYQSYEHCRRYNHFGIGFNKNEMIDYGASPVLYIVENRRPHQDYLQNILTNADFQNNQSKSLISWYHSMNQPYNSNNLSEFFEREWRIIRILPFHWKQRAEETRGKYNEQPFKGEIERIEIGGDMNNEEFYLQFDSKVIENIIVPNHYAEQAEKLINDNNLACELIIIDF